MYSFTLIFLFKCIHFLSDTKIVSFANQINDRPSKWYYYQYINHWVKENLSDIFSRNIRTWFWTQKCYTLYFKLFFFYKRKHAISITDIFVCLSFFLLQSSLSSPQWTSKTRVMNASTCMLSLQLISLFVCLFSAKFIRVLCSERQNGIALLVKVTFV